MYKVIKTLNNNAIIATDLEYNQEVIILDKGLGFKAKVADTLKHEKTMNIYRIQKQQTQDISNHVDPIYLEITNDILNEAKSVFGDKVDGKVLIPLADHISFAIERIEQQLNISNPFTNDIKLLFPDEYQIATKARDLIFDKTNVMIPEDEISYITLHVHSALSEDLVSSSMQMAIIVQESIELIEKKLNTKIDQYSISYARLLNHIKYMLLRLKNGEQIEIDMQEYVKERFPTAYHVALAACTYMGTSMKQEMPIVEVSYLAIHIERIMTSK